MCFSVQADTDLKKVAKRFGAVVSKPAFSHFKSLQKKELKLGPTAVKKALGLTRAPSKSKFPYMEDDGRIYPGTFAPVIVYHEQQRKIVPMRYRVRPKDSLSEIPSKFNVFNARLDSLTERKTWKSVYLKNHCLFPFQRFYEWVEQNDQKKLVHFDPDNSKTMWAAGIYDLWKSSCGQFQFHSFALITDKPPLEVERASHDRCPTYIKESYIDSWLQPKKLTQHRAMDILTSKQKTRYNCSLAS